MKILRNILNLCLLTGFFGLWSLQSVSAQPTLSTDTCIQISTCPGTPLIIPYSVENGNFNFGNVFYAQLSDAFGNFDNPDTIASQTNLFSGLMLTTIPEDLGIGILYRIRVVASDPPVIGSQAPLPTVVAFVPGLGTISADPGYSACEGESITLQTSGGSDYQWSTGESGSSIQITEPGAGNYGVTVTDLFGCQHTDDPVWVTISEPLEPGEITMKGDILTAPPAFSYQWYHEGVLLQDEQSRTLHSLSPGVYTVETGNEGGCKVMSKAFRMPAAHNTWIYPNPVREILNMDFGLMEDEQISYELYSSDGMLMRSEKLRHQKGWVFNSFDMSQMAEGLYVLRIFRKGAVEEYRILKAQ